MRKSLLTITVIGSLLLLASTRAQALEPVIRDMEKAANDFIDSLSKELAARTVLPMETEESAQLAFRAYHGRTQRRT